jgi:hypothetical protein
MAISVHNISKTESIVLYADARPLTSETGNKYEISFTYTINDHMIKSTITIQHDEDLSFNKAEQIIKDIVTGGNLS